MKAVWKGQVLAVSKDTVVVESNHYFPVASLTMEYFKSSDASTRCPWSGVAGL